MGRAKRNYFDDTVLNMRLAYSIYSNVLTEIALSSFKYKNLPETIDDRYLETSLFINGKNVWFNDDVVGLTCLDCVTKGSFNIYGEPIKREAYSKYNKYRISLDEKNSVIMWNNKMRTNSVMVVEYFAKKLANIDNTIDVNVNGQKTPVIIQGTEKQKLTLINMYKEYTGNQPLICAYDGIDISTAIKSIPTVAPYVSDRLTDLKNEIWKQALNFLGVGSSSQKRERMLKDEIMLNQGEAFANRQSRLESRKTAVEKINKMFGTNIEVEFSDDVAKMLAETVGGEDNGKVHNDVEDDM